MAATRYDRLARIALAAGCLVGWLLRQDILRALVAPWELAERRVYDGNPHDWRVLLWHVSIAAVMGTVVALPLLVLAALSIGAPRFATPRTMPVPLFLCFSYVALAAGVSVWAGIARPQLVAQERANWDSFPPLPWAYVERDLTCLLLFSVACQTCVVFLMLVRARWAARQLS